ncbi:hypothetical protein A9Q81_15935 [Gammaproteobacteria bacterium 42_54_T18]|nr:hypothetical protein A9Q81_15935 [Gammaproteobacteria bacterium 42_54_T18]
MIDTLKDTLSKVNEWVKFAEAKNAANIAFCSTAIFSLMRMVSGEDCLNGFLLYYSIGVIVCFSLSLIISLFSFVPKLEAPWLHIGSRDEKDNVLYFGHACKYSAASYLDKLYSGEPHKSKNHDLEIAYSNQIVVNSKVAFIKFKQFDLALWFTITAILSPIGTLIVAAMRSSK